MGKIIYNKAFQKEIFEDPFHIFTDTSSSPGATFPINDLDGNIMASLEKDIAYYGTVSHTDLYTSDELASAVGVTQGTSQDNQEVWHKYYWNGGIHFWRKPIRRSVSWNAIWSEGAVFATGTSNCRKGHTPTNFNGPNLTGINQDAEVTKNGVTYAVRLMEGSTTNPWVLDTELHGSEWNLIILNLHAATNSGSYSNSPTDSVSYANWNTSYITNDDFLGWKTNFGDTDFTVTGNGKLKLQQETTNVNIQRRLDRGFDNLSQRYFGNGSNSTDSGNGWAPVLTVKHSSFTYE